MGKFSTQVCVLAALLMPALAWSFPIEVQTQLNGAPISVEAMDLGDNIAAVRLHNYGEQQVQCRVRFRGGPQTRTRKASVAAQQRVNLMASFNQQIIRMRVKVSCHPVKER